MNIYDCFLRPDLAGPGQGGHASMPSFSTHTLLFGVQREFKRSVEPGEAGPFTMTEFTHYPKKQTQMDYN